MLRFSHKLALAALLPALPLASTPAAAERPASARLVHCGTATCLRLSGRRSTPDVAVRIGGQTLPVEGGRSWRATVPLAQARDWRVHDDRVTLTLADTGSRTERTQAVMLPPGALGGHVELASLVIGPN